MGTRFLFAPLLAMLYARQQEQVRMTQTSSPHVTRERFAQGMTWDAYLLYIASPENLAREASDGGGRIDRSGLLRQRYEAFRLNDEQVECLRQIASMPGGPAKLLVIAEEWSSDCRRD